MRKNRKVDLATTTNITTTYAGEFAGKYCGAALLSADTLDRNLVTIKPNIKYKETAKHVALANVIADASCDFTDTGTITLTERIIEPKELQVNMNVCKIPFQSDWEAISMGYSAHDHLPPNFTDYFIGQVTGVVAENTELDIWNGDGSAGHFNGFIPLMTADGTVVDVPGVSLGAGGITATNVVAEITKLVNAIPKRVYRKADMTLYVADDVARAYAQALGTVGYQMNYWVGEKPMNFGGIDIQPVNGLPQSYMVAAQKANLWFGTGLMSDFNELTLLDMAMLDGSKNVRFIMRYTAGVQYCEGSEIVLYTPIA